MTGAKSKRIKPGSMRILPSSLTRQLKEVGSACMSFAETNAMGVIYGEPGAGTTKTAEAIVSTWKEKKKQTAKNLKSPRKTN